MPVPNIFGTATSAIPLSQLDTNFATPVTIGNTAVQLGNTVTSFGNVTLTNVTISSGNVTVTSPAIFPAGSNSAPSITTTGDTNTGIFFPAADTIAFSEGGVESARFDASGNFGLGVTPVSSNIYGFSKNLFIGQASNLIGRTTINYTSLNTNVYEYVTTSAPTFINSSSAATQYYQYLGAHVWQTSTNTPTANAAISFTQAMTLDASGNLLVGTTSTSGNAGFQVLPNANATGSALFSVNHVTGSASGHLYASFNYDGSGIGSITQSGTTAVLYNVTSDQRLKENIVDAPEFGSVIDSLQVRSFDWKAEGSHQRAGFIAQELVTVAPEAVHQPANPDDMMAVDYSKLVPMLVKEIQSLRKRLAAAGI
jgi:hypothetical protein